MRTFRRRDKSRSTRWLTSNWSDKPRGFSGRRQSERFVPRGDEGVEGIADPGVVLDARRLRGHGRTKRPVLNGSGFISAQRAGENERGQATRDDSQTTPPTDQDAHLHMASILPVERSEIEERNEPQMNTDKTKGK